MVWLAGLGWLGLTPGSGVARQVATPASPGASARRVLVSGDVVDGRTYVAVKGAVVRLVDVATGRGVASAQSSGDGSFRLPRVPPGTYALSIERVGYETASGTLVLYGDEDPAVTATLAPDDVDLEPVVVTVARPASRLTGFEQRRVLGNGTFVTRADIEEQRPFRVTDLFRTVAGVRVQPGRFGNTLTLRGGCRPTMYFDGVAVDAGLSLDLSLQPDDVEAIEVHSNASAPAQYARNACGVILVWTREPVRARGRTSWWKGLAVVGGFLGVRFLLTR